MSKPDGGRAFPQHVLNPTPDTYAVASNNGMTLRDWFAGQALTSMLNTPASIGSETPRTAAALAYRFADAMIAERSRDA